MKYNSQVTRKFSDRNNNNNENNNIIKDNDVLTKKSYNYLENNNKFKVIKKFKKYSSSFSCTTILHHSTLLFLLPPSCMVVPIGKLANKFSFSTHFSKSDTASNSNTFLPPMSNIMNIGMNIQSGVSPTINSEE